MAAGLIFGEPVTVTRRRQAVDDLGEVVSESLEEERVTCVVTPGPTSDLDASRPEGAKVAFSLGFPRGYGKSLRGCLVDVRGERYEVVGDPRPYDERNVPGPWTMTVEVAAVEG
nr:hypothetical protein [uncultured Olsenella sp.]